MAFPKDFVWGAAAASYQIEGGAYADGKGLSVWDMMCRKEGAIWNGQTGEVACDLLGAREHLARGPVRERQQQEFLGRNPLLHQIRHAVDQRAGLACASRGQH